jgi:hypothetical protein
MATTVANFWRDPRLVACTAAILWLAFDDNPAQPYATFWDPGAAVMLSIIFGDSLALAVQRRWDRVGVIYFSAGAFMKLCCQSLFYVQNAAFYDTAFLLVTHFLIASGFRKFHPVATALRGNAGLVAVAVALVVLSPFEAHGHQSHSKEYAFYTYAAARAFVPYLFWTALLIFDHIYNAATARCRTPRISLPPACG